MIQNAADASATKVTIKFETLPSTTVPSPSSTDPTSLLKHTISNHTLRRLLISNNGLPFSEKDWARLKRIADGNPDETKIGAFGVGFYSVFDDCEEPFVSSGSQAMAFYWKGNALFTRRLDLGETPSRDTTFVLDYRNDSSPIPSLMQLCQFLSSSLTFVALEEIELWIDDWNSLKLSKKTAPGVNVPIPRDVETKTTEGLMKVTSITQEIAQVDAAWMRIVEWNPNASMFRLDNLRDTTSSLRSFFSKFTGNTGPEKPANTQQVEKVDEMANMTVMLKATVFLHINTASIQPSISTALSKELERATRKPPPKRATIAILTPSYDANIATGASESQSEILASILPTKAGRIFIGFPTQQTTGLNAHVSAPSVIPTVERESIDLNTRYISKWNLEMLRAVGIVCRIAWSAEMSTIKSKLAAKVGSSRASRIRKEDIVDVLPEAIHTANQFVFRESTPSSVLGQTIEDAFWMCNKNASIEVLSTCGVIPSHQTRIAPKDLSFMDSIPALPEELVLNAKDFVQRLTDFGLVTEITVSDIKRELESNTLRPNQIMEFLSWLGRKAVNGQLDSMSVKSLLRVAVANDEDKEGNPTRLIVFADIAGFLNPHRIPADLPVPPSVMPFQFTRSLSKSELEALGWGELSLVPWIRWLVANAGDESLLGKEQNILKSPAFAGQVLPVLSKGWEVLSSVSRQAVIEILQPQTVIPTRLGMKQPTQTYFASVRLFDDLPVVHGLNGVKEKFLVSLGVRKTVELGVIFDRLINTPEAVDTKGPPARRWNHVDLIRYLTSVREDIPSNDIQRLKNTSICNAENDARGTRYKIAELYEPKDSLRALGLPIIEWPGIYNNASNEGKFLTMMGLKSYPSGSELVRLMVMSDSEKDAGRKSKALAYFLSEYHTNGYAAFDISAVTVPFLPVESSDHLSTPKRCFTDEGASLFGFSILQKRLHPHASKLGVKPHPPMSDCLQTLIRQPPTTQRDARTIFKYLAGRVSDLSPQDVERVGNAPIIPVAITTMSEKGPRTRLVAPRLCYLGDGEDYKDIFDFVDFGQEANLFLMAVGSRREPTKNEIARMLVKEPARISAAFQSSDKYLMLLRTLAEHLSVLKKDRELFSDMKKAKFLLASRDIPPQTTASNGKVKASEKTTADMEEDLDIREWSLSAAKDIVVVDDFQSFNLFKEHIFAAPQEEALENFYVALGAIPLSSLVEEQARFGGVAADQSSGAKLHKVILERARLFLHDQPADSIQHGARWLETSFVVQVVNSITLTRSLKGRRASHTQKRSAIVARLSSNWGLCICPGKYDLYEISQSLVHLILKRPKLHSTLTLEMLLKTDLLELRARGYNVERILRQKAHEARMAEDKRQKQMEEERRALKEKEAAWAEAQAQRAQEINPEPKPQTPMPGIFPESPNGKSSVDETQAAPTQSAIPERTPRGLFANLSKRFGLDKNQSSSTPEQSRSLLPETSTPPPPPYSDSDPQNKRPEQPVSVSSPHRLNQELLSAVQACRPHGSSDVYSRPETNQISESKSYCDERPSQDLEFVATLPSGVNVLFVRTITDRSAFLVNNRTGINLFASVLLDCGSIFSMRADSLSIFYDPGGKTIAFNRAGSIFCNYFYFQQLQEQSLLQSANPDRTDAIVYWWVILCHELAHNLVGDHSSAHSYYTEGFVAQYFPRVAAKLATLPQHQQQQRQSQK
jgi:hypothetical protein